MMSAEYFPSGTVASSAEFRHYGLASEIYTHFTSPIRRYADLIAHRQLAAAIAYDPSPDPSSLTTSKGLEQVCKNINTRHRNAQMAGRASVEYYVGQALKGKAVEEDGWVMKVFENGFVVFVPRFGIEGVIRLKDILGGGGGGGGGGGREMDRVDGDNGSGGEGSERERRTAEFDEEEWILKWKESGGKERKVELFEKVRIGIMDEVERGTGKRKVRMELR